MQKLSFSLVISGAGTNGPLEVGAIAALYDSGLVPDSLIGTSAGAITSGLLALGKKPTDLKGIVLGADFKSLIDYQWWSMIGRWTLASNRNVLAWLDEITTGQEMQDVQIPLVTISGNLVTQKPTYWRSHEVPTMPLSNAIYASMAIPFIFPPYLGEYVDGGTVDNLGINEVPANMKGLALMVVEAGGVGPITGPIDQAGRLLSMMLSANVEQAQALASTRQIPVIPLNAGNKGFMDREMTQSEKSSLYQRGYEVAQAWIESEAGKAWLTQH